MIRLGVLGSTRGTNLTPLVQAIESEQLKARIELVISNKADALILDRAAQSGLPNQCIPSMGLTREAYDAAVSAALHRQQVEWVVLIGYMRILSADFIHAWRHRIINVHPSLLPAFAGLMDLAVHQAVLDAGVPETGCTVHYVTEEVDAGPVILQKRCPVLPGDTPDRLKARVQALEGDALIAAIQQLAV